MPGLFEQFPHTNLHELNLDWLIDMLNQFKEELENSAVLSVNGETGHVTLYESENVILPALPEGVDQWRLVRLVNGQYAGILFYNGNAYIQRGNETMRLLTQEDIPSSSGVVSWNGLTGVVNVTGQDIPVDDTADADSILQALETEHTERVNADNTLSNSINAINNSLSYDWFSLTNYVSPAETGANGVIHRYGKIRTICFQGVNRVHAEDDVLGTLPEEDRPYNRVFTTGNIGEKCIVVKIDTNGQIAIYTLNGATESARLYFGMTYIVNV